MSQQHLIPFNLRSPSERIEIARLGGQTKSPLKRLRNQLKGLKWSKDKNKTMNKLVLLLQNPELNGLELMYFADEIKKEVEKLDNVNLKLKVLDSMINIHKVVHGDKIISRNLNFNVDIVMSFESWIKMREERLRGVDEL